ncbi:MAG: hypothetical protein WCB04_07820, partial [Mycobacteriales bacterium]
MASTQTSQSPAADSPATRRRAAPLAAAFVVVLLLVGTALVIRATLRAGSQPGGQPAVLRLSTPAGPLADSATVR